MNFKLIFYNDNFLSFTTSWHITEVSRFPKYSCCLNKKVLIFSLNAAYNIVSKLPGTGIKLFEWNISEEQNAAGNANEADLKI